MTKENLEDLAYRSVIRAILESEYQPGDFLLETKIAEEMNLSRTPIRHALARLNAEGFLEKKKKKGYVIPVPSREDARQVFEAREIIEGQTAASAALRAEKKDIKELRIMNEKHHMLYNQINKEEYTFVNEKFHMRIAKISKNEYLERCCRRLLWRSNVYIFFFDIFYIHNKDQELPYLSPFIHNKIVDAIESRDSENARSMMGKHIRETYEMLFLPWKANKS